MSQTQVQLDDAAQLVKKLQEHISELTKEVSASRQAQLDRESKLLNKLAKKDAYHEDKYRTLMQLSQDEMTKCRRECDGKMKGLVEGFKRDMQVVDQEVGRERAALCKEVSDLKTKLEKSMHENVQLRQLVEVAAKSDAKSSALVLETKHHYEEAHKQLTQQRQLLKEQQEHLASQTQQLRDKELDWQAQIDNCQYKLK